MTWDSGGGNFDDNSCRKDSPDRYLIAKNPRQDVTGMISNQVSSRNNADGGLTFPRSPMFYRAAPDNTSKTFTINVTNVGALYYVFNGADRVTTHVNAQDPTINVSAGDIINFSLNVSGHPFLIKTVATTGTGNQLPTFVNGVDYSGGGVSGNGSVSGTVTLYTATLGGTTLYYICQFHGGMSNSIVIT